MKLLHSVQFSKYLYEFTDTNLMEFSRLMHSYIWIHQETEAPIISKLQTHLNNFEASETKHATRW
jgi:hypothetical protein